MAGGRVSHSIDIGKEFGNGPPQEPKQEEPKEEEDAVQTEEVPPAEPEKPQESTASGQQPPSADAVPPAQTAQEFLETAGDAVPEEEEEAPDEPLQPPDPAEEDVNEMLTKHIPQLRSRKTFWGRISAYRVPLFILFVILVGGWFLLRSMDPGAEPQAGGVQPPAVGPLVIDNVTPLSAAPENKAKTGQDSREELAAILVQGLRD